MNAVSSPKPPDSPASKGNTRAITSVALIISVVVHLVLFLFIGTVVIFEGKIPIPMFESAVSPSDLSGLVEEIEAPPLMEEEVMPDMPEDSVETDASSSLDLSEAMSTTDLVVSSAVSNTNFSIPAVSVGLGTVIGTGPAPRVPGAGLGTGSGTTGGKRGPRGPSVATLFGSTNPVDGLIGRFYDFRRDKRGKEIDATTRYNELVEEIINTKGEVDQRGLDKYFSPEASLSASMFLLPGMNAEEGPKAFGLEPVQGRQRWLAYYKGTLQPKKSGTYRFIGAGDELLIVRINGKLVLDATWQFKLANWTHGSPTGWKPDPSNPAPQSRRIGPGDGTYYGDWFDLDGGPFEMEVVIGEGGGNIFGCYLTIQAKEDADEKIFSIFKTEDYKDNLQPLQQQALAKGKDFIKLDGPTFQIPGQ